MEHLKLEQNRDRRTVAGMLFRYGYMDGYLSLR